MEKIARGNLRGNEEEEANARMLLRSRDYTRRRGVALAPFSARTKRASYACNAD